MTHLLSWVLKEWDGMLGFTLQKTKPSLSKDYFPMGHLPEMFALTLKLEVKIYSLNLFCLSTLLVYIKEWLN